MIAVPPVAVTKYPYEASEDRLVLTATALTCRNTAEMPETAPMMGRVAVPVPSAAMNGEVFVGAVLHTQYLYPTMVKASPVPGCRVNVPVVPDATGVPTENVVELIRGASGKVRSTTNEHVVVQADTAL